VPQFQKAGKIFSDARIKPLFLGVSAGIIIFRLVYGSLQFIGRRRKKEYSQGIPGLVAGPEAADKKGR
jgi:hypothetical protein